MSVMSTVMSTRVRCPKHPKEHPLACLCAKDRQAQYPQHLIEEPVRLGSLGYVYLTSPAKAAPQ